MSNFIYMEEEEVEMDYSIDSDIFSEINQINWLINDLMAVLVWSVKCEYLWWSIMDACSVEANETVS